MTDSLFGDLYNPDLAPDAAETFAASREVETQGLPKKRIAGTSIEAYRVLASGLPRREGIVLVGLGRYRSLYGHWPTAYELYRLLDAEGQVFDINGVRPRLNALHQRGRIRCDGKRPCTVTRRTAYTWAIDNQEG